MSYEGLNVILLHGNFAANGQAAAELAIPFMKSRRRIALPKAGTKPIRTRLQQGFATREMGSGWVKSRHWGRCDRCPLYPQKRTLELSREMSALCQKQTFCGAATAFVIRSSRWPVRAAL